MTNLEQIKSLCKKYDISPQKSRSQNFLFDSEILKKIVELSGVDRQDEVLEVGPGLGVLTVELEKVVKKVFAVELDKKLSDFLKIEFLDSKVVEIINNDILKTNFTKFLPDNLQYKIVANLPYNITSKFLRVFLESKTNRPSSITVMVQKEVAQRICEKPGDMSLLSLSVQFYGQPEIKMIVNRDKFYPVPEVDSAILHISKIRSLDEIKNLLGGDIEKEFWRVAKVGFSAKRKKLVNNLSAGLRVDQGIILGLFEQLKLDENVRAQNLSVKDWVFLAKKLKSYLN